MNRQNHLLWLVSEECNELGQRASKVARFGFSEIQSGHVSTNAQRLVEEYAHVVAAMEMLQEDGLVNLAEVRAIVVNKKRKVEDFLLYSKSLGTLKD